MQLFFKYANLNTSKDPALGGIFVPDLIILHLFSG